MTRVGLVVDRLVPDDLCRPLLWSCGHGGPHRKCKISFLPVVLKHYLVCQVEACTCLEVDENDILIVAGGNI